MEESLPDVARMAQAKPVTTPTSSSTGTTRHRYQPSRGSSASMEERATVLQQLQAAFGETLAQKEAAAASHNHSNNNHHAQAGGMLVKRLVNRMEFRMIPPGKMICEQGEATPPSFYVVLNGRVHLTMTSSSTTTTSTTSSSSSNDTDSKEAVAPVATAENGNSTTAAAVEVFGKELLESAEFRKTRGGKLVSSLVTAPYSVVSDEESGCRLAVLSAVAYREVVRLDNDDSQAGSEAEITDRSSQEGEDDGDNRMMETEDEEENKMEDELVKETAPVIGAAKAKADDDQSDDDDDVASLHDDQLFATPQLQAVGEAEEETEHTEVSASEGAYEIELAPDPAGRRIAPTDVRRMFIPPTNVTQERIDEEEVAKFVRPSYEKAKEDQKQIKKAMKSNPLLESLPKKTFKHVTAAMKKSKVKAGDRLIEHHSQEDRYYCVVSEGDVDFSVNGMGDNNRFVGGKGFTFGEEALTYCRTSGGSPPLKHAVTAKTDCEVFRVEHVTYRKLVAKDTHEERTLKLKLLEQVTFVETMAYDHLHVSFLESLTMDRREKLLDIMHAHEFKKGDVILSKKQSMDNFLIVSEGQIELRDMSSELHTSMQDETLATGKHFGDQVLCHDIKHPRMAEVVGKSKIGTVHLVSRDEMKAVVGTPLDLIPVSVRTLVTIEALRNKPDKDLSREHLLKLSHRFRNKTYKAGTVIVEADQETDACLYIIRSGDASCTKGRIKKGLLPGAYFGEDVFQQCRKMNVTSMVSKQKLAAQSDCVIAVITLEAYNEAMSHADDFLSLNSTHHKKPAKKSKKPPAKLQNWPRCNTKLSELEKITCLGEGNFGQIWLVRDQSEEQGLGGKPCVLKIQSKHKLLEMNQVKVAIEEKQSLQRLHHPFIIELLSTYQDDLCVYMLLEYLPGGELYSILSPPEGPAILPEPLAKFYALCVADALVYMHSRDIIYRDLKPENVLVDRQGFPKLIDFGFSKWVNGPTYTLCGTPGYIAPEVLLNVGHGKSYDHWQLGVLIYDMLSYDSPYFDPDDYEHEQHRKVLEDPVPKMVGNVSAEAWHLITGLLVKDPKQRLGSLRKGERDILNHKWFSGMNLSDLREKKIKVPWGPEMSDDPFDTSYYEDFSELDDITIPGEYNSKELEPDQAEQFVLFND